MTAARGSFEFFQRMKKKPPLQAILDDLENMSMEDIDACGQALWIRQHLHTMKREADPCFDETIEDIANQMMNVTFTENKDFEVREYTGGNRFVGTQGTFQIEANYGDLFQITDTGVVWGTSNLKVTPQEAAALLQESNFIDNMDALKYRSYIQDKLKSKYKIEEQEPDPSGKITSADFTHAADRYTGEVFNSEKRVNIGTSGIEVLIKKH